VNARPDVGTWLRAGRVIAQIVKNKALAQKPNRTGALNILIISIKYANATAAAIVGQGVEMR